MNLGNYTVKALADLRDKIQPAWAKLGHSVSLQAAIDLESKIRVCQPFLLPEGGRLWPLAEGDHWKWEPKFMRLPFQVCALEYRDNGGVPKILLLEDVSAGASSSGAVLVMHTFQQANGTFIPMVSSEILVNADPSPECLPYKIAAKATFPDTPFGQPITRERALAVCRYGFSIVMQMLCALQCKNVTLSTHAPDPALQKKRAKAGKLPLLSYKILMVGSDSKATLVAGSGGVTRSSPRTHLRRGHVRRLPGGDIYVNDTIVRGGTAGLVIKDYSVRRDH